MEKVLLDTDVILDFLFDRKPFSVFSSAIISLCEKGEIKGFLTPVIYSNLYYLLRQSAGHDKVIDSLKKLFSITDVLVMDKDVVKKALYSEFKDFEDSLQNFAVVKNGEVSVIITRNTKDFITSEISTMTPEAYLKSRKIIK